MSLQRRLLLYLLVCAPLVWGIALYFSIDRARHEVNELYDTELIRIARQVQSTLGPPLGKGLVAEADGSLYDQWTYYYGKGDMNNPEKNRFKLLQIRFDKAGRVASYNWSGDLAASTSK